MGWACIAYMDGGRLPKMAMSHVEGGRRGRGRAYAMEGLC